MLTHTLDTLERCSVKLHEERARACLQQHGHQVGTAVKHGWVHSAAWPSEPMQPCCQDAASGCRSLVVHGRSVMSCMVAVSKVMIRKGAQGLDGWSFLRLFV